ncbi:MAG: SGNH/GDSL hydrolase family protein [Desulfurellales bacterium]|nr:MAG: SGNH/GDSL hydrolase family protein [Desulfurellales bacterium]
MRRLLFALAFVAVVMLSTFAAPAATAQTVPPRPVYLAVGDSLTVGLYAAGNHGFAHMVADALPQYSLEIAAVTGDGIDNTIAQLPLELAEHRPELVTVEVGINNLGNMGKPTFLRKYVKLLHILRDNGYHDVIACTVPWTGQSTDTDAYTRALEFNQVISSVTPSLGYTVADCWGATVGHYEYLSAIDGFHPNRDGHRAIADAILRAILRPVHWLPDVRR